MMGSLGMSHLDEVENAGSTGAVVTALPTAANRSQNGGRAGLVALVLAAGTLTFFVATRVLAGIPKLTQTYYDALNGFGERPVIWFVLGLVLLASIAPVAASIVLGHRSMGRAKVAGVRPVASAIALGIGYTLVVFWGVRLISAIANAGELGGGFRIFVEYVGLWA